MGFISGFFILFCVWCMGYYLAGYYALWYDLKSSVVTAPVLFFLLRVDLAIKSLLCSYVSFRTILLVL